MIPVRLKIWLQNGIRRLSSRKKYPSRVPALRRTIQMEPLEDRCLLSGTPQLLDDLNLFPPRLFPFGFTDFIDATFFVADDGISGRDLWKTDGTKEGTVLVKDIRPGEAGSSINNLTVVGDTLFFTASGVNIKGKQLWKTDGTEQGTVKIKSFDDGDKFTPELGNLINVGGTLFFSANDDANGRELWKSDGTEEGTVLVKDIWPGIATSGPGSLKNVGGTLFFTAFDGTFSRPLWKSDGTEQGTVKVSDFQPSILIVIDDTLFFFDNASRGLWKSDGSNEGTVKVKDFSKGEFGTTPSSFTNVGGTLFFQKL